MNEYTIQYQNFHPSTFTKDYLDAKIGGLASRAPIGSVVRAVFTVENGGITATLRVATCAGDFFASSKGRFLKDVNRRLLIQARKQIQRWQHHVRAA